MSWISDLHRKAMPLGTGRNWSGVAAALVVVGCSSVQPPTKVLTNAELSVRAANDARAGEFAAVDLKNAREKLDKAKQAMAAERYNAARRLAESAQVDAELAEAKAEAEIMRRAADRGPTRGDAPPTKAELESRQPLSQGSQ